MDFSTGAHWVPVWVAERNACEKCGWDDYASCDQEACESERVGSTWFTPEMGVPEAQCLRWCNPSHPNANVNDGECSGRQPRHDLLPVGIQSTLRMSAPRPLCLLLRRTHTCALLTFAMLSAGSRESRWSGSGVPRDLLQRPHNARVERCHRTVSMGRCVLETGPTAVSAMPPGVSIVVSWLALRAALAWFQSMCHMRRLTIC